MNGSGITKDSFDQIRDAVDIFSVAVTVGVLAGVVTWVAAIATAIWAVFRAMNEIHKWRTRHDHQDDGGNQ